MHGSVGARRHTPYCTERAPLFSSVRLVCWFARNIPTVNEGEGKLDVVVSLLRVQPRPYLLRYPGRPLQAPRSTLGNHGVQKLLGGTIFVLEVKIAREPLGLRIAGFGMGRSPNAPPIPQSMPSLNP